MMSHVFSSDWFELTKLPSGTIAIREPHHFEDVFSYAVPTPNGGIVLFDTGMGLANISEVLPKIPTRVFLTHSHWDHVGDAANFHPISVFDHPYETERLKKGWGKGEIIGYERENFSMPLPVEFQPENFCVEGVKNFTTFYDEDELVIDGLKVLVMHTPGHTPGSTCFFLPQTGELITGDTLYPGPEYLHLPESNVKDYGNSLQKLNTLIGSQLKNILPGHNSPSAEPKLLFDHIQALQGKVMPQKKVTGTDEFGPFVKKEFVGFSLIFPDLEKKFQRELE